MRRDPTRILLNPSNVRQLQTQQQQNIDPERLREANNSTSPCHICRQMRKPMQLKVKRTDISGKFDLPSGMLIFNISYCHDNDSCEELARNVDAVWNKYVINQTKHDFTDQT